MKLFRAPREFPCRGAPARRFEPSRHEPAGSSRDHAHWNRSEQSKQSFLTRFRPIVRWGLLHGGGALAGRGDRLGPLPGPALADSLQPRLSHCGPSARRRYGHGLRLPTGWKIVLRIGLRAESRGDALHRCVKLLRQPAPGNRRHVLLDFCRMTRPDQQAGDALIGGHEPRRQFHHRNAAFLL